MTRAPSLKLRVYLGVTAVGALAGLATGRPELVALAAPFAFYVAVGLALAAEPVIAVSATLGRERVLEGDDVPLTVRVDAQAGVGYVELELRPHFQLVAIAGAKRGLALDVGEPREAHFTLRPERWGGYRAGVVTCRVRDRFGLIDYELAPVALGPLRVFPRVEALPELLDPAELQATAGSRVARERGEGIEFAELRPFVAGDRVRRINWRATAKRGVPYVSDRHPERNADVILFLDTFSDVRGGTDGTLALAVRAAAALAAGHLARRDRVGVVGFGGVMRGLGPTMAVSQLYRILDAVIGSEVVFSYAQKDVSFVPRQLLPAKALVIAITPLIDERSIRALLDLRARGFDLVILDVSPVPFAAAGPSPSDRLAHRLWLLHRQAFAVRFARLGVPVSVVTAELPLLVPIATAAGFRRRTRARVAA